jgi:hypothetical protein
MMYLFNLRKLLRPRFKRTGSLNDLDAAVEASEEVVKSTPFDHPNRVMYLNNLGISFEC